MDDALTISPELFAQIRAIQVRTRRLVTDVMAGDYESTFKGRGMEFEEVREYQPGDDVRHIDWNVTARTGLPHVKVHKEERELTVMLVVDVSASGSFGTVDRFKRQAAAEAAAILAYAAVKSNDRVGLVVFSDQVESYIPPKKGSGHVWRVIREILGARARRRGTDIEGALRFLAKVLKRRAVVFVVSDFIDSGYDDALRTLARRHEVTAVTVGDPAEQVLPDVGLLEVEDAETGQRILIDTSNAKARARFDQRRRKVAAARDAGFRAARVSILDVRTDRSTVDAVVRFFREGRR